MDIIRILGGGFFYTISFLISFLHFIFYSFWFSLLAVLKFGSRAAYGKTFALVLLEPERGNAPTMIVDVGGNDAVRVDLRGIVGGREKERDVVRVRTGPRLS
jgi:hypothetical protein